MRVVMRVGWGRGGWPLPSAPELLPSHEASCSAGHAHSRTMHLRWWTEYADRKNDETDEYVANSLLYDRNHLPRSAPAPDCVLRPAAMAAVVQEVLPDSTPVPLPVGDTLGEGGRALEPRLPLAAEAVVEGPGPVVVPSKRGLDTLL